LVNKDYEKAEIEKFNLEEIQRHDKALRKKAAQKRKKSSGIP
jgi:hypothetical protein